MKNRGKILVVEDNELNLLLAKDILCDAGYEVLTANNGVEGLDLVQRHLPDIILLDIMMPGIDGLAVCKKIRENEALKNIRIMMLTAKAMTEDKIEGLNCGADDYITKPYSPTELLARINVQLRSKKAEDENERLLTQIQKEIEFSKTIQDSFLLDNNSIGDILETVGIRAYIYKKEKHIISGDFCFPKIVDENTVGIFLADTCGHGIQAALISMRILSLIERTISPQSHPSEFLQSINKSICHLMPQGKFVAANYALFNDNSFFISNAGLPYPIFIPRNGGIQQLEIIGNPLGVDKQLNQFNERTGRWENGDYLLIYTDGLSEATNEEGHIFGEERIIKHLERYRGLPPETILETLVIEVKTYTHDTASDDITIIILEKGG